MTNASDHSLFRHFEEELTHLRSEGLERSLVSADEFRGINLSSNDYLGLSHHPDVLAAASQTLQTDGSGGTSSRLLAGTRKIHQQLEQALAAFFGKEAALVFSSGYHANTGIIPILAGPSDGIFVDRLCHASIFDGIKLSGARFRSFAHNDLNELEIQLKTSRQKFRRALIVTEGLFSMDGDIPPLQSLVTLAERYGALTYLDEAHSIGLFGPDGSGVAAEAGLLDRIDVLIGTLSKSLGSQGAFVASQKALIDLLISRSRSFLYTTALAPPCAAAALASLRLLPSLSDRRACVLDASSRLRAELSKNGFDVLTGSSQIIPVWTGDLEKTKSLSDYLFNRGFFVPSIRPPTVPIGEGRVRLSVTYDVVQKGLDPLIREFLSYPQRPHRPGEKCVPTH